MTKYEFLTKIQEYYGQYPKGQLPYVAAYLDRKRESFLDALFDICIRSFSAKWKTPPDVAIFEELAPQAHKVEDQQLPTPNGFQAIEEDCVSPEVGLKYIEDLLEKINKRGNCKIERYGKA